MTAANVQRKIKAAIASSITIGSSDGWDLPRAGNLLVVTANSDATVTIGGTGWTAGPSVVDNNAAYSWWKFALGTESSITATPASSADIVLTVAEYSGILALDVQNSSTIVSTPGTTTTAAAVTTTAANDLIIGVAALHTAPNTVPAVNPSWTNSFTNQLSADTANANNNTRCVTHYAELLDAGAVGSKSTVCSWTNNMSNRQHLILAFKVMPASGIIWAGGTGVTTTSAARGTTSTTVSLPAAAVPGRMAVITAVARPSSATITAPAGWLLRTNTGGGTGTEGLDTGTAKSVLLTRILVGDEGASVTVNASGSNALQGLADVYASGAGGFISPAAAVGAGDNTSGTNSSVVAGAWGTNTAVGDVVHVGCALNTDATSAITAPTITATSATYSNVTARSRQGNSSGNQSTAFTFSGDLTAGAGNTNAITTGFTWAATSAGAHASVRLREIAPARWTGEGGTGGTGITTGNSGGASGTAFDTVTLGSGAAAVYDATIERGTLSAKLTTGGSAADCAVGWTTGIGTVAHDRGWVRGYFYLTSNPGTAHRLFDIYDTVNGVCGSVYVQTTGTLQTRNSAGTAIQTTTAAVPLNQWFRVEAMLFGSATAGEFELKLFSTADSNTPTETVTAAATQNTRGNFDGVRFGAAVDAMPAGRTLYLDDLGVGFGGYLGPTGVVSGDATVSPATIAPPKVVISGSAQGGAVAAVATIAPTKAVISGTPALAVAIAPATISPPTAVVSGSAQTGSAPVPATISPPKAVISGSAQGGAVPVVGSITAAAAISGTAQAGATAAVATIAPAAAVLSGTAQAGAVAVVSTVAGATAVSGTAQTAAGATVSPATISPPKVVISGSAQGGAVAAVATISPPTAVLSGSAQGGAVPVPSTISPAKVVISGSAQGGAAPPVGSITGSTAITGSAQAGAVPVPATLAPPKVVISGSAQAGAVPVPATITAAAALSGTVTTTALAAPATISPPKVVISGTAQSGSGAIVTPATITAAAVLSGTARTGATVLAATITAATVLSGTGQGGAVAPVATIAPVKVVISGTAQTSSGTAITPATITGSVAISGTPRTGTTVLAATIIGGTTITGSAGVAVSVTAATITGRVAVSGAAVVTSAALVMVVTISPPVVVMSGAAVSDLVLFVLAEGGGGNSGGSDAGEGGYGHTVHEAGVGVSGVDVGAPGWTAVE